ncbi:MAG: 4Fe-4S dicluster domain-containing protein, partial [Kiloniellaceae bacterium]
MVRVTLSGVGMVLIGGLVHVLQRSGLARYPAVKRPHEKVIGLLRPPGALPERDFLAACIRCYRCQDACEPGAIQFYTEQDGLLYHTPYVDPARKGCSLCALCQPQCPTGALRPVERKEDVDMGSVELREDLCLSYRARAIRREQELLVQLGREPTEVEAEDQRRGPCGECFMFC